MYSRQQRVLRYLVCKSFCQAVACLFNLFTEVFTEKKIFNFDEMKFTNFSFYGSCF